MPKTWISKDECPFQPGDRVKCIFTDVESTVLKVEDDVVWCVTDEGKKFYRTWWHDLDQVFHKSGGGLTRIAREMPVPEQPVVP